MRMVRLYADAAGESHFEDVELDFAPVDFAPPAAALEVSDAYESTCFVIVRIPPDWPSDWHPSPKRQIWVGLGGTIRVSASDGETREIPAGTPWLMEDKSGKGHVTAVAGDQPVMGAITQLE
jgi:hypothetical protein